MKKNILLFLVIALAYISILANNADTTIKMKLADTQLLSFFKQNNDIHTITVLYKQNNPYTVFFNYTNSSKQNNDNFFNYDELFDMEFEGDKYFLSQKYDRLYSLLIKVYKDGITYIPSSFTNKNINVTISKDTIFYSYLSENTTSVPWPKNNSNYTQSATYYANMNELSKMLTTKYHNLDKKEMGSGSTVMFKCTVLENDSTKNLQLLYGYPSNFSDFIANEIKLLKWIPENQGGKSVKSYVKVFAKMDTHHNITISYSSKR